MASSDAMSDMELRRLSDELERLSPYAVQKFYEEKYTACRLQPGTSRVPEPRTVQELIAAWNLLRKWQG
jgi:hypothetical protein